MNIESTSTALATKNTTDVSKSSSANSQSSESASFKDEMEAVKTQDSNKADAAQAENTKTEANQKTSEENASKQVEKNQLTSEKEQLAENLEQLKVADSLKELNSKIATMNEFKSGFGKTQTTDSKTDDKTIQNDYSQTIKMNSDDAKFFLNLVENKQMSAQINPNTVVNTANNTFTEIKTAATQAPVQVSATLLDALNKSMQTGKPLRIDFDNDVAVIMKIDKDGVLSANFIPGSAAVESYLKNNISSLRQSFEEQNLPYNELSYSNQQQKQQSKNNKEKDNE